MKVGQANYGGKKEVFKIKDGDNVFRILPPLGDLADAGKWSMYYRVEWGYKDTSGKMKPFQDVRVVNRQTGMVEVESAAHIRREQLKKAKDSLLAQYKADPTNQTVKDQLKEATEAVKRYNLDSKHYLNAVSLDGKIGLLKIGHKTMLALRSEIDKLTQHGIDPLSIEKGLFFNFHRSNLTGNFQDVNYQVTPYKTNVKATINGVESIVEQNTTHAMDAAFISRLDNEVFALDNLYPEVTADEVQQMVTEGSVAVDRILGKKDTSTAKAAVTPAAVATPVQQTAVPEVQTAPVQQVPAAVASTDMEEDDFLKSIGAI